MLGGFIMASFLPRCIAIFDQILVESLKLFTSNAVHLALKTPCHLLYRYCLLSLVTDIPFTRHWFDFAENCTPLDKAPVQNNHAFRTQ